MNLLTHLHRILKRQSFFLSNLYKDIANNSGLIGDTKIQIIFFQLKLLKKMKNLLNSDVVEMFQVEELEERLENKWELEAGANSDGPYCKVTCTIG